MITESSTWLYECTKTDRPSTELRTAPPEMMHPSEITECSADPRRESSLNTNFAGG